MRGIDTYISELLFEHDCVILPGFGGFLTNYSGARIHPIKHSFQPPARTVVFNANLTTNDGLLIEYISRRENIPYQDAALKVNAFASDILQRIKNGKNQSFRNIGQFSMGKDDNIMFDPDLECNYLEDAFGLPSFVSPAIRRESVRQRLEKQLTPTPTAPKEEKKRNLRPVAAWAAGIAIPVAAAVLMYFYNPAFFSGLGQSYASFVPAITLKPAQPQSGQSTTYHSGMEDFRRVPEKAAAIEAEPEPESIPEAVPEVAPAPPVKKYQVVVGAFSEEQNAHEYVQELRSRNYQAGIIGTSANGLIRVSISGFDKKKEALSMLREVRQTENPSAWLLIIR